MLIPLHLTPVSKSVGAVSNQRSFEACELVSPQATLEAQFLFTLNTQIFHQSVRFFHQIHYFPTESKNFCVHSDISPHDKTILHRYCLQHPQQISGVVYIFVNMLIYQHKGSGKKNDFFSSLLLLRGGGGRRRCEKLLGFFIN